MRTHAGTASPPDSRHPTELPGFLRTAVGIRMTHPDGWWARSLASSVRLSQKRMSMGCPRTYDQEGVHICGVYNSGFSARILILLSSPAHAALQSPSHCVPNVLVDVGFFVHHFITTCIVGAAFQQESTASKTAPDFPRLALILERLMSGPQPHDYQ